MRTDCPFDSAACSRSTDKVYIIKIILQFVVYAVNGGGLRPRASGYLPRRPAIISQGQKNSRAASAVHVLFQYGLPSRRILTSASCIRHELSLDVLQTAAMR